MCELVAKDIEVLKEHNLDYQIVLMDSNEKDLVQEQYKVVSEYFGMPEKDILKCHLSAEQVAHLGPGSFGLTTIVSLKELEKKIK